MDDHDITSRIRRLLERFGFQTMRAEEAARLVEQVAEHVAEIDRRRDMARWN